SFFRAIANNQFIVCWLYSFQVMGYGHRGRCRGDSYFRTNVPLLWKCLIARPGAVLKAIRSV
ncbi:hypothetical protein, partial [uncultured Legionella sp.]|uniref:hypothetical protein n=1 Tax=uncultured Legionella sp. TaxID=210934 RepID=UPI002636EB3B